MKIIQIVYNINTSHQYRLYETGNKFFSSKRFLTNGLCQRFIVSISNFELKPQKCIRIFTPAKSCFNNSSQLKKQISRYLLKHVIIKI